MKKWFMWSLLLPTYFISFTHRTVLSSIGSDLASAFSITESAGALMGVLAGTYFIVYSILQLPSGILADSFGPRKTVAAANLIMGLATIVFAGTHDYSIAIAARFFIGFGGAFNFIALLRLQVNWFEKRRFAFLTSLTAVVGTSGGLFGIGPFAVLSRQFGWRNCYTALGVIALIFVPVILFIVKDKPDSTLNSLQSAHFRLGKALKQTVSNKVNLLMFAGFGLSSGAYLTLAGFWGVPFLEHCYGMSHVKASMVLTLLTFGIIAGSLSAPVVIRMLGSAIKAMVAMMGCAAVLWALLIFKQFDQSSLSAIYPLIFCLGFCLSFYILAYTVMVEINNQEIVGTAFSFVNMGGFIAVSVMQPLVGFILDRFVVYGQTAGIPVYPYTAYRTAFSLLMGAHVIAVIAFAMAAFAGKNKRDI
jgi:MFS family permease